MSIIEILILGLALSMDAFAVTISNLMAHPQLSRSRRLMLPITFGLFQGLMPLVGYFAGTVAADLIDSFAGPIALVILGFIGGKMVFEAVREMLANRKEAASSAGASSAADGSAGAGAADAGNEANSKAGSTTTTLSIPAILIQGVATSIDALIVGVTLLALGANIFEASSLIAATTFACCLVALAIGKRFGVLLGDKAQIVGGLVLIAIGIKACFF